MHAFMRTKVRHFGGYSKYYQNNMGTIVSILMDYAYFCSLKP